MNYSQRVFSTGKKFHTSDFMSILGVRIVCMINVSVWSVMHVSKSPFLLDTIADLDYSFPNKSSGLGAFGN